MQCPIKHMENAGVLLDYCAHKLNVEGSAVLERLMQSCAACREFASDQRMIWSELDKWKPAVISEDFDRKLYARVNQHERSHWWQRFLSGAGMLIEGKPAVSLAAACLTIIAGIFLYSPEKTRPAAPPQELSRVEALEPEQVERGLEDLEMLKQLSPIAGPKSF